MANKGKTIVTKGVIKSRIPDINEQFDYWTVIDNIPIEIKRGTYAVLCRCKCGSETAVRVHSLVNGLSKGCRCRTKEILKQKGNYVGDLSDTFFGRYSKRAKSKGMIFTVSKEYLWGIYLKQNKKCALTGLDIIIEKSICRKKRNSNITASLDRINSKIGYIEGNVQWVHKDVNKMKQDLTEERLKQLCKLINLNL